MRSLRSSKFVRSHEGYCLDRFMVTHHLNHVRQVVVSRHPAHRTQHAAAAAVHAAPGTFISPWQPLALPAPVLQERSPAAASINLLVVESFAGSYSAARAARLLNSNSCSTGTPSIHVSAYAAIELDPHCYCKGPNSRALGISDPSRFLSINGSVTDASVQGCVLNFVQRILKQSEDAAAAAAGTNISQQQQQQRIDGILFVGGPPCTFYSLANNANAAGIAREPELYKRRLFESDQIVQAFMTLYAACKALAANSSPAAAAEAAACSTSTAADGAGIGFLQAAGTAAAATGACRKSVVTCFVMENPWSADLLRIQYPRGYCAQESRGRDMPLKVQLRSAAAAAGLVEAATVTEAGEAPTSSSSKAGHVREHVRWGLRARRFLVHELQENGGPLVVTHHNWCSYGHISHPWKSTAIFSDLPSLTNAPCICSNCRPKGISRMNDRLKHLVTVEGQRDSSTRAVWPDGFMLRVAWLFGAALRQ